MNTYELHISSHLRFQAISSYLNNRLSYHQTGNTVNMSVLDPYCSKREKLSVAREPIWLDPGNDQLFMYSTGTYTPFNLGVGRLGSRVLVERCHKTSRPLIHLPHIEEESVIIVVSLVHKQASRSSPPHLSSILHAPQPSSIPRLACFSLSLLLITSIQTKEA